MLFRPHEVSLSRHELEDHHAAEVRDIRPLGATTRVTLKVEGQSDLIEAEDLHLEVDEIGGEVHGRGSETLDDYLNRLERQAILEALQKTEGNRTAAARQLGVTFRSMRYRLERLGIE